MPIENIWMDRRTVHQKYTGTVTIEQLYENTVHLQGHPDADDIRYIISDWLDVEHIDIDPEEIQKLAAINTGAAITNPNIEIAYVMNDESAQALAQLFHLDIQAGEWQVTFFNSVAEAEQAIKKQS